MNAKGVTSTESSCGVARAEKTKIPSAGVVATPIRSKLCVRRRRLRSNRLLTHTYARSLKFVDVRLVQGESKRAVECIGGDADESRRMEAMLGELIGKALEVEAE